MLFVRLKAWFYVQYTIPPPAAMLGFYFYYRFALSQWETALLCNDVSHWLGENIESALEQDEFPITYPRILMCNVNVNTINDTKLTWLKHIQLSNQAVFLLSLGT